jgi:hypothetical protein
MMVLAQNVKNPPSLRIDLRSFCAGEDARLDLRCVAITARPWAEAA